MRAEVGFFEWTDLEHDRANGNEPTSTPLVFSARPIGGEGGETFQLTVCTVDGLAELVARDGVVSGRHHLFVSAIETGRIQAFIEDRLRRLDGDDWSQLSAKIARIGLWEFEDYAEYRPR